MFDFAWSEIALIGVVALVLIGPKDMPVAIKAVSDMVKKARKMAGEFQGHVDEMVKDTSIAEVRQQINEIRNFDIRGEIERTVDADGSLRSAMKDVQSDPFANLAPVPEKTILSPAPAESPAVAAPPADAPAFIPPTAAAPHVPPSPAPPAFIPPAFVPPGVARPQAEASTVNEPGG